MITKLTTRSKRKRRRLLPLPLNKRPLSKLLSTPRNLRVRRRESRENLREKIERRKLTNLRRRRLCTRAKTLKIEKKLKLPRLLMVISK